METHLTLCEKLIMRNLSLISVLIALAVGAIVWQKLLLNSTAEPLAVPVENSTTLITEDDDDYPGECGPRDGVASECGMETESEEQAEMTDQQNSAHDTMMKSFDGKFDTYKDSINGR